MRYVRKVTCKMAKKSSDLFVGFLFFIAMIVFAAIGTILSLFIDPELKG